MFPLTRTSQITGVENSWVLPCSEGEFIAGMQEWDRGALIQNAFPGPQFSADDREFIMNGSTPEEWDDLFGEAHE